MPNPRSTLKAIMYLKYEILPQNNNSYDVIPFIF